MYEILVYFFGDNGVWEDINLNVMAIANGWEVTDNMFTTHFVPEMVYGVVLQSS
jgi:hypothetical protein